MTALAALGVLLLLASPLRAEDRLQIDVTDPSRRGYQIAVQRFAGDPLLEPRLAEELDDELVRALEFSLPERIEHQAFQPLVSRQSTVL